MDWEENSIKLYLDDELLNEVPLNETVNGAWGNYTHPFKQPHYLLLNLALGANGGEPDVLAFPMKYEIDYVRVYQKKEQVVRPGRLWLDDRGEHINAHGGACFIMRVSITGLASTRAKIVMQRRSGSIVILPMIW